MPRGPVRGPGFTPREPVRRPGFTPTGKTAAHDRLRSDRAQAVLRCENYKPLVAAVHGYAIGHALGTALLCDLVVAAEDTRFQVTETSYGVPTASFWAHIACATGASFANDVVLTGRFFTTEEAFRAGLITRVAASGRHPARARARGR